MSLEFNRRSFLKYSAAAAVAVAGSSLLVGCGEDEYQKTGSLGAKLKLMALPRPIKLAKAHLLTIVRIRRSPAKSTSSAPLRRFLCV